MALTRSVIPHLVRAVVEKRSGRIMACQQPQSPQQLALCRKTYATQMYGRQRDSRVPTPRTRPSATTTIPTSVAAVPPSSRSPNDRRRSQAPRERDELAPEQRKRTRGYIIAVCIFGLGMGFYVTYLYVGFQAQIKAHAATGKSLPQNADVSDRWRDLTRNFDEEVECAEWFMWMGRRRRQLAQQAYGNVLEVSVGTGRNMQYYNLQPVRPSSLFRRNVVNSLTFNDQSPVMVAAAEKKFDQLQRGSKFQGKVDFVVGDASVRGVIQRPQGGFDTIVQSMGICSMADPAGFLRTMGHLCRQPGETSTTQVMAQTTDDGRGGKIVLLEHGRSNWPIVNKILDAGASLHADRYGCWWNKDIEAIIHQSGLEIEKVKRYHAGTTWEIHLRPQAPK